MEWYESSMGLPTGAQLLLHDGRIRLVFSTDAERKRWETLVTSFQLPKPELAETALLPRTGSEKRLWHLIDVLKPRWFLCLGALYEANSEEPDPVVPMVELGQRMGRSYQTARRLVQQWLTGQIAPEAARPVIRHMLLDIRPSGGNNKPYQFKLRDLDEALGTLPGFPVADTEVTFPPR